MKNISSPFIEIGHWRRFLSSKKVGGESNSQVDLPHKLISNLKPPVAD
jgi:hypothetical protein